MSSHPAGDIGKVFFGSTGVEKVAGCVAVIHCAIYKVGLALEHANAVIELGDHSELLVCGCTIWVYKGAVMGCHLGDVAIFPAAKLRVVVAGLSVCGRR